MVIRNFAKYLSAAILAVACTAQEPTLEQAPTPSEPVSSEEAFVPGVVAVELTEEMAAFARECPQEAMDALGAASLERVFPESGEFEARHRKAGLHRFYYVKFAKEKPVTKATSELRETPGVLKAVPERPVRLRSVFNDPYLSQQWHLVNTNYPEADIHVKEVWEKYTMGSSRVTVAIMDEPFQDNHEDLEGNLWDDGQGHHGYNTFLDDYTLYYNYSSGHGTHVAGVVAAVNNNGKGVSSIAGGNYAAGQDGVRLMSISLFAYTTEETEAFNADLEGQLDVNAFVWAADHGAVISQNSWGYPADDCLGQDKGSDVSPEEMAEFKSWTIDDLLLTRVAVDYFIQYAGCDPKTGEQLPDSPMKGGLVFFSAGNEGEYGVDYDPIGTYEPVISVGAFGLDGSPAYYSNYGDWVDIAAPGGDGFSEGDSVWSTLSSKSSNSKYGGVGWAGTSMASPHASGVAALIISYFGGPGFTAQDARDILFGGLGEVVGDANQPSIGKRLNALASFEWALAHGYSAGGGAPYIPEPPVITLDKSSVTLKAHESVSVGFSAHDPNGDALTFSCTPGSSALTFDSRTHRLVIVGRNAPAGTYTATVTVSDGELSASASLTYTILPNHAPVARKELPDTYISGLRNPVQVSLDGVFTDEDGEYPRIGASSEASCVRAGVSIDDTTLELIPLQYGTGVVTVTATDELGASAQVSLRVAVVNPDQPVRAIPETASTETYICLDTRTSVTVVLSLYASTGGLVYQTKTEASAFDPIRLDVSALAPGRYTAVLEYNGYTRKVRVIKY